MAERYVLKFSKTGYMRYISHLDLLRLFKRMFRTGGIEIRYSQGFNPHPKLTFAQPLSLGYSGTGELLDFETAKPYDEAQIAELLKDQAPCGIDIISCRRLEDKTPSLASAAESAIYAIEIPAEAGHDWERKGEAYMAQQKIEALKRRKKDKKMQSVDIKPMIRELVRKIFLRKDRHRHLSGLRKYIKLQSRACYSLFLCICRHKHTAERDFCGKEENKIFQ